MTTVLVQAQTFIYTGFCDLLHSCDTTLIQHNCFDIFSTEHVVAEPGYEDMNANTGTRGMCKKGQKSDSLLSQVLLLASMSRQVEAACRSMCWGPEAFCRRVQVLYEAKLRGWGGWWGYQNWIHYSEDTERGVLEGIRSYHDFQEFQAVLPFILHLTYFLTCSLGIRLNSKSQLAPSTHPLSRIRSSCLHNMKSICQ